MTGIRPGEVVLDSDPALAADATLAFIGRWQTPWQRGDCPKNLSEARERGGDFAITIDAPFRGGLSGLRPGDAVIVLYWMDGARRDLIVQAPSHRPEPTGDICPALSARPNPVAIAVVRLLAIDAAGGRLSVDAADAFDGTPVLDIKPWLPSVDVPADL